MKKDKSSMLPRSYCTLLNLLGGIVDTKTKPLLDSLVSLMIYDKGSLSNSNNWDSLSAYFLISGVETMKISNPIFISMSD